MLRQSAGFPTSSRITASVPSHPTFSILNTAVGGSGGSVNDSTLPQSSWFDDAPVT